MFRSCKGFCELRAIQYFNKEKNLLQNNGNRKVFEPKLSENLAEISRRTRTLDDALSLLHLCEIQIHFLGGSINFGEVMNMIWAKADKTK